MFGKLTHIGWAATCIAFLALVGGVYAGDAEPVRSENMRLVANYSEDGT